jgi:hypothetical protein
LSDSWRVGGGIDISQNKPAGSVTSRTGAGYLKADAGGVQINQNNTLKLNVDNLLTRSTTNTLYRGFAAPGVKLAAVGHNLSQTDQSFSAMTA